MARITIQMGHVNGLPTQPGAQPDTLGEQRYVKALAPCLAARLRWHGHAVTIIDASYQQPNPPPVPPGDVFISLHCDGNANTNVHGGIVGYPLNSPGTPASRELAWAWKLAYQRRSWPDGPGRFFRPDNLTRDMSEYYMWRMTSGYSYRYLAEHGALTNAQDEAWMWKYIDEVAQAHVEAIERVVPTEGVVPRHPRRRQPHSGLFIQSTFHTGRDNDPSFSGEGNRELVATSRTSGMFHRWRDLASTSAPWNGGTRFAENFSIAAASLIQSTFGFPYGNFEVVARIGDKLAHFYRDPQGRWLTKENPIMVDPGEGSPTPITGVIGNPAFIQGKAVFADQDDLPRRGNFHVVFPRGDGTIVHFERVNDDLEAPWWRGPDIIYSGPAFREGSVAVTLIQSNYGRTDTWAGNLEVVARINDKLAHFYQDNTQTWKTGMNPVKVRGGILSGVSGTPGFIQSDFGRQGNFEVVVPQAGGGMAHYLRNNDSPEGWTLAFGSPFGNQWRVSGASLIQNGKNLEVLARMIDPDPFRIRHFYNNGEWRVSDWADGGNT